MCRGGVGVRVSKGPQLVQVHTELHEHSTYRSRPCTSWGGLLGVGISWVPESARQVAWLAPILTTRCLHYPHEEVWGCPLWLQFCCQSYAENGTVSHRLAFSASRRQPRSLCIALIQTSQGSLQLSMESGGGFRLLHPAIPLRA